MNNDLDDLFSDFTGHIIRERSGGRSSRIYGHFTPESIDLEKNGIRYLDGIRHFPLAVPQRIMKLRKEPLSDGAKAYLEIDELYGYLSNFHPDDVVKTSLFVLQRGEKHYLGSVQDAVAGFRAYDPFSPNYARQFDNIGRILISVADAAKKTGKIIDLGGAGNFMIMDNSLVFIDCLDLLEITYDPFIKIDETGYPRLDLAVQAMHRMEIGIMGSEDIGSSMYGHFLQDKRLEEVRGILENIEHKKFLAPLYLRNG